MLPGLNGYEVLRRLRARRRMDSGADADGQGRRLRPDRRLRPRRRRLPDQAVLVHRAGRAAARAGAARGAAAARGADRRHLVARPGAPGGGARSQDDPVDAAGVRTARIPDAQQGHRRHEDRDPAERVGRALRRTPTTSSRCMSATCGARSISRSAPTPSRPSAASATGWSRARTPTATEPSPRVPPPGRVGDRDAALVCHNDFPHDRQAEPGSARASSTGSASSRTKRSKTRSRSAVRCRDRRRRP